MFEQFIAQLNQNSRSFYFYECNGGARNSNISRWISRTTKFYNYSSYGSRRTESREGTFYRTRSLEFKFGIQGRTFRTNTPRIAYAAIRQPPSGAFHTIYSMYPRMAVAQFTGDSIWSLFDVKFLEQPEQYVEYLYQLCYGLNGGQEQLPAESADLNRYLEANAAGVTQIDDGFGTDWGMIRNRPVLQSERDFTSLKLAYEKSYAFSLENRKSELTRNVRKQEQEYKRAYQAHTEARKELLKLKLELDQTEILLKTPHRSMEMEDALRATLDQFYCAYWMKDGNLYACTIPIICEEPGIMKADIGRFLVKVSDSVKYYREDGKYSVKGSGIQIIHPHLSDNTICWGTYSEQIEASLLSGDIATTLLLTYHHLCSVNPDDCYQHLHDYVQHLRIKRKVDFSKGETDFPVEQVIPPTINVIEEVPLTQDDVRAATTAATTSSIVFTANRNSNAQSDMEFIWRHYGGNPTTENWNELEEHE